MKTHNTIFSKSHLLLLVVLMCFAPLRLSAQTGVVLGHIVDAHTLQPLSGSVVRSSRGSLADHTAEGGYLIHLPKGQRVKLTFQHVGYKRQQHTVVATDTTRLDIRMLPDSTTLGEALVVARSEISRLKEAAIPISVIGQQQLQGTATNINDVLARVVGVTVRNTGGVGSPARLSLRGLEGKRVGMFVDEVQMAQFSNFVSISDVPTSMVERIEVYKGIVPYKFGGSALGGAVNVVTKEYPPTYLDASYEVGSFNSHQLATVFKRSDQERGLQFGIGGGLTFAQNNYAMPLNNLDGRIVKRDHDRFGKILSAVAFKATKWWFDEIKLEQLFFKTRQEVQGIDLDVREAYNYSYTFVTGLSLKRKDFFLEGCDFDFSAGYTFGRYGLRDQAQHRYDWDGNALPPVSAYGGEQNSFPSDGRNRSVDWLSKLNVGYVLDRHHSLNLNLYGTHTRLYPKDELMDKTLGFKANFPSRMTSLTVGLSYDLNLFDDRLQNAFTLKNFVVDSHSRSIDVFSVASPEPVNVSRNYFGFSDAFRYKLNNEWMVKASFNSEVRVPTTEELIGNGYSILASPALQPERTTGGNLGTLWRRVKRDGGLLEWEVSGFYNMLNDMIRFTPDMIPTMARYRNFGRVRTWGVEVEAKGDVHPLLYLYANATYQDLRDVRKLMPGTEVENPTKGMRIPNIPYLMTNFGGELHKENLFGGNRQNSRFLFDASYVHQFFYDFEMSKFQERKIPTAFTFDAALEHSFNNDRWTFTLKVKNLFDRQVVSEFNRPLPGRSLSFKVRYLLK